MRSSTTSTPYDVAYDVAYHKTPHGYWLHYNHLTQSVDATSMLHWGTALVTNIQPKAGRQMGKRGRRSYPSSSSLLLQKFVTKQSLTQGAISKSSQCTKMPEGCVAMTMRNRPVPHIIKPKSGYAIPQKNYCILPLHYL